MPCDMIAHQQSICAKDYKLAFCSGICWHSFNGIDWMIMISNKRIQQCEISSLFCGAVILLSFVNTLYITQNRFSIICLVCELTVSKILQIATKVPLYVRQLKFAIYFFKHYNFQVARFLSIISCLTTNINFFLLN